MKTNRLSTRSKISHHLNEKLQPFRAKVTLLGQKINQFKNLAINQTNAKIKRLLHRNVETQEPEIFHMGGTKVGSFDPRSDQKSLHPSYFYERIPIRTPDGEIFLYGKTLKPYVDKWIIDSKSGLFTGTFQEYMMENFDPNDPTLENVRYLDNQERERVNVKVNNNSLEQIGLDQPDEEMKILPEGRYAFVLSQSIDEEGVTTQNFYAAIKGQTDKGKIQHSSFTRGGNIISSGLMTIGPNGSIDHIENYSGHYRPKKAELIKILTFLNEQGYDLQQCYVRYHFNVILMVLSRLFPLGSRKEILTRGDIFLANHTANQNPTVD